MRAREHLNCIREEIQSIPWYGIDLRNGERKQDRYFQENAKKLVPEGVEGRVAYKGTVKIPCSS